jgi:hypothetical protein
MNTQEKEAASHVLKVFVVVTAVVDATVTHEELKLHAPHASEPASHIEFGYNT